MKPAFISKRSIGNNQTPVVLLYPTVLPYLLPFLIPADIWLGVPPRLAVHHNGVTRSEDNSTRNRVDYWGRWRREREEREGEREGERERRREEGKLKHKLKLTSAQTSDFMVEAAKKAIIGSFSIWCRRNRT